VLGLPHPSFQRECDRNLVLAAYRAGDLTTARVAALRLAAPDQPSGTQLLGVDWLERITWDETGKLLATGYVAPPALPPDPTLLAPPDGGP